MQYTSGFADAMHSERARFGKFGLPGISGTAVFSTRLLILSVSISLRFDIRTLVRYNWTSRCNSMQSAILRARLESALGERIPAPFTDVERRVLEHVPTGIVPLGCADRGLPRGAITEFFGPPSSGRTSAVISILAEAAAQDEVCALIDGNNAFDPKSAAAAGVELNRLLWVRCRKLEQVLKTTDLLLQGGGFGRVIMDLSDLPLSHVRSIPLASWFRLQRTIERTPTVLVVMSPESVVKSAAALVLRMEMRGTEWSTFLNGLSSNIEIVRSRKSRSLKSYVRMYLHSECVR